MFLLKKYSKLAGTVSAVLLATTLTACFSSGASTSTSTTTTPVASFAITSTAPALNATEVGTNSRVIAVFNMAANPDTLTNTSFTLALDGETYPGKVSYNADTMTATLIPDDLLTASVVYTATVTTSVKDKANNSLSEDYSWTFETDVGKDTNPPTADFFSPEKDATGVVLDTKVSVVFSEALAPSTVTADSFKLTHSDGSVVAGSLNYVDPTTVVLTPDNYLKVDADYTLTLSSAITDIAGIKLANAPVIVGFRTGSELAKGPAAVNLGTAGNYVILAKSAVSTTGTTTITGDIGVSPAATSFLTGFSLTLSDTFATSEAVTGKLYAADMAVPTPANMTTAISDMEIAYTDAAGRTTPDETELGEGNITGMTLEPGLYKWGTGLLIADGNVTLKGGANDVWILQIAEDLTIGNGVIVTLEGGAVPKNIFWQVAGAVTLGTTADVKGIILSQTKIVINNGAVLNGRALAQTAVTLDANAVTQPAK